MSRKSTSPIYLDYAATTPIDPKVLKAMLPYLQEEYGNPSSLHQFGQRALAAVDEAREKIADFLGCSAQEVVFTGSATEANNLAIKGLVGGPQCAAGSSELHIITSAIEHDSVLETCRALEKEGVKVTYLPVTKDGFVRPVDVEKVMKENTVLVSIMYANNEIGTIQPIAEIGKFIKNINTKRYTLNPKSSRVYFHTDAVQAANYLDCNTDKLGVDLLTMSSHKIYGPKGVGALYIKKGTSIKPLAYGGGQEFGLRSGTENVAGIAGFGAAIEQVLHRSSDAEKIRALRDRLIGGVLKNIPSARLNGSSEFCLPNNVNICFPGVDAESLIIALDQEGIAVSSGSACSTRAIKPSHVLLALGLSEKDARSSVRITLGRYTTEREIAAPLKALPGLVKKVRMLA